MDVEMKCLQEHVTWEVEWLPSSRDPVGGKWVYRVKLDKNGSIEKFKARYVAKGYSQNYGVDYTDTFAPTTRITTVRTVIAIAAQRGNILPHIDIRSAYLNANLEEEIYVEQPRGYVIDGEDGKPLYCRLLKGLYGLKQAGRRWNETLHLALQDVGMVRSKRDYCLYVMDDTLLIVWADDIIITGSKIDFVKQELAKRFKIDDRGILSWFLGIEIRQLHDKIEPCQEQYIEGLLAKFKMSQCNGSKNIFVSGSKDTGEKILLSDDLQHHYRPLVGGLV